VAKRTRQVQDDVQSSMRRLQRPITFSDLARVWTGTNKDRYRAEIQRMSEKYASRNCGQANIKRGLSDVRVAEPAR
jgi:hypothetical protein